MTLVDVLTRPLYGAWAGYYDDLLARLDLRVPAFAQAAFDRAEPRVRSVLDLGCGTGGYAAVLAEAGYRVIGVDLAAGMIAVARQRLGNRVRLIRANMTALPLGDAGLDAILCRGVLNDLTGPGQAAAALAEAGRVLRPGGLLLLDVRDRAGHARRYAASAGGEMTGRRTSARLAYRVAFDEGTGLIEAKEVIESGGQRVETRFVMRTFTPDEVRGLLALAGFEVAGLWGWYDRQVALGSTDRIVALAQKKRLID